MTFLMSKLNRSMKIHNKKNLMCRDMEEIKKNLETKKDFPVIGRFIQEVFGEREQQVYDWLGKVKNNPTAKENNVLFVVGKQGSGKTLFEELVRLIFDQESVNISHEELYGNYNDHFHTKHIVTIDEPRINDYFLEIIKVKSSAKIVPVNAKLRRPFLIHSKMNFLITTNDFQGVRKSMFCNINILIFKITGWTITATPYSFNF